MNKLNALKIAALFAAVSIAAVILVAHAAVSVVSDGGSSDLFRPQTAAPLISAPGGEKSDSLPEPAEDGPTVLTLSFVGDCMLATMLGSSDAGTFNAAAATQPPEYFFSGVSQIFENDSLTVANCENVFTDSELEAVAKNYDPAYWYRSKAENAGIFTAGGVDVVSLANNHTDDYGDRGHTDTIAAVEAAGLEWGDDGKPLVIELEGLKFGLYLCTMYSSWGANKIFDWLAEAVETTDYQIVYYHGGTERVYVPDDWRVAVSRKLADAGADLVVGGHPHVLQPLEFYGDSVICHSLGNFLFGGSRTTDRYTVILQEKLTVKDGEILASETVVIPCYEYTTPGDWKPVTVDPGDEAYDKIINFMYGTSDTLK